VQRFLPFPGAGQPRNKSLLTLIIVGGGAVVAGVCSLLILADDWKMLATIVLSFAGLAFTIKILNDWRQGLYIFFGWLFFEDFARKYLGNNMAVYFAKDFLVVLVYLSFFISRRRKREIASFKPPFLIALLLLVWFAMGQVFNPASTSIFYGFLGLKLYFLYVPLMYLGYALIASEKDLRRFFMFNAVVLLVVAGLGIAQAIIGPKFLNPTVIQDDIRDLSTLYRTSPLTGQLAYRPNSVFVSTGRFQNLIIASWVTLVGFGGYLLLRSKVGRGLAYATIGVLAGAAVMSTSRGVVMWCGGSTLVIVAAFLWGAPWKQKEVTRTFRSIQRVALLAGLAIVLLTVIFPEEVGSRFAIYSETLSPYSTASELAYRTRDYPLRNFLAAFDTPRWAYGYGTGTASLGIQYVARILKAPNTGVRVENGYGQLIVEMGVVGLLLWILLGISICASAWKVAKSLRGSPWFPLAFVIFWLVFLTFFPMGYNSIIFYQDFLVNAYLWILLGVLFRLPKLALSAQFAPVVQAASNAKPASQPNLQPALRTIAPNPGSAALASCNEN
jgi:hypothetical protein